MYYKLLYYSLLVKCCNLLILFYAETLTDIIKDEQLDDTNKPVALKLLEEYDQSSGSEPEEMPIVKKSGSAENKNESETNEKPCSGLIKDEDDLITEKNEEPITSVMQNKEEVDSSTLVDRDSKALSTDVKNDTCSQSNEKNNNEQGKKRKNTSKKESKPIKKVTPMRTSRTEVVERKGALLEAVSGFVSLTCHV